MASGLPKPSAANLAPGAVAVLERPDQTRLRNLLDEGLGVRRTEGFGWVRIAEEWTPPTPAASAAGPTTVPPEFEALTSVTDRRHLHWLADRLRDLNCATDDAINRAFREAGAKWLSNTQKDNFREVLLKAPPDTRTALAEWLERGPVS
jgi:CRISPR-associated protein Csx10